MSSRSALLTNDCGAAFPRLLDSVAVHLLSRDVTDLPSPPQRIVESSDALNTDPHTGGVQPPTRPARWLEIDCLRVLSASTLFYWHVGLSTGWPLYFYSSWATGVFVTTSVFCAVRFSRHRKHLLHGGLRGAWLFIADRFVAVYPAYAI